MRLIASVLLASAAAAAWAVPVEKWVQTTRGDFQNGKAQGTAVLALGQVTLAPELKPLLPKPASHLWALAADADGTVYAASGFKPRLLRLRGEKVEELFAAPGKADLEVLAVAVGPKDVVYASVAPSGTLYRIAPDGKAEVLHKSADPYLWALAIAPDGGLYAATGPNGKLLKIAPDGKAAEVFKADAPHILSLLVAPDGSLYAGTSKGLLYHVPVKGTPHVAYEAAEGDIRALARDPKSNLYFATAATSAPQAEPPKQPPPAPPPEGRRAPPPASPAPPSAPGATVKATNALYRLAPDGTVTKLLAAEGEAFYALTWYRDHLHAGTGNDGKLYRIEEQTAVQLADLEESQITAFALVQDALFLATANAGQVYRVEAPHAAAGSFTSEVYDTASSCRWGQITWQAQVPRGATLSLATRTGNTAKPDASWSAWSAEYAQPSGEAIASPPGRFVQYRATLKRGHDGAAPVLDEVVIAYLRANEPPRITEVKFGKPPEPRQPPPPEGSPEARRPVVAVSRPLTTQKQPAAPQRGPLTQRIRIAWAATDPNNDGLFFALFFRGEDETTWKKVTDRLGVAFHDWDTESVPDGPYRFRIVASDSRTNPPDAALEGQFITETVIIDNTPPTLADLKTRVENDRRVTVTVRAADATSRIESAEYALDGGEWMQLTAADGVFDSPTETLEFRTAPLDPGEHTVVVRAKDEADNSGAAKAVVKVK
jgi:hypothetical protein